MTLLEILRRIESEQEDIRFINLETFNGNVLIENSTGEEDERLIPWFNCEVQAITTISEEEKIIITLF